MDGRWVAGVGLICAAGAGLGALGLGHREFWHDEFCSLLYATAPEGPAAALGSGGNPPLYFFLLRAWIPLFGSSEAAVRSLSALFSALALVAFAGWVRALGLSRRATVWSTAIFALAPLRLFYAREARGYSLLLLVLCAALWVLVEAVRRPGLRWWALYALVFALGLYTHNLMLLMSGACVVVGLILARERAMRARLVVAQAAAFALYLPWLLTLVRQPYGDQSRWIASYWRSTPPILAIPRSLLAFAPGGGIPRYISWPSPPQSIQILSGGVMLVAAACLLAAVFGREALDADPRRASAPLGRATPGARRVSRRQASTTGRKAARAAKVAAQESSAQGFSEDPDSERELIAGAPATGAPARRPIQVLLVLLVLLFGPVVVLWIESALGRPIYLVGRYDLVSLPAFCALAGGGFAEIQRRLAAWTRPVIAEAALATVLAVLGAGTLVPRYRADLDPARHPAQDRIDLLAPQLRSGDLVVSIDLSASNALYLLRERRLNPSFATFPREIVAHWGWFNVDESLRRPRSELIDEARDLLHSHLGEPDARIWVFLHPPALVPPSSANWKNPHQELLDIFWSACRMEGLRPGVPGGADAGAYRRVGLVLLRRATEEASATTP